MAILKGEIWTKFIVISFPSGLQRKKTFRWSARKRAYVIIGFPEKSKKNMSFLTKDSQFQAGVQIVGVAQAKVSKRGKKSGRGRKGRA